MKTSFKVLIFILGAVLGLDSCQQTVWDSPKYQKITLDQGDSLIEFRITDLQPEVLPSKKYYCFKSNQVFMMKGGYSGKLLNGEFTSFGNGGQIRTKGTYKDGLKDGIWSSWKEGAMISQYTFKYGQHSGAYSIYDDSNLVEQGTYVSGEKEGIVTFFEADTSYVRNYVGGVVIEPLIIQGKSSSSEM